MKTRLTMVLVALLGAGAVSVLSAAPASAVPGLHFGTAASALDGTNTKSVSVACPAGTKPFGGGFFVTGGAGGRISVTRLQALPPSNAFSVVATEVAGPAPAAWRLHGHAICGAAPAGLDYVSFSTVSNSTASKTAIATCPAGKKVIGTGARLDGDAGQVLLDDVRPSAGLSSVSVVAHEDETGFAGNWQLSAFAVCANPLANLTLQTAVTPTNSADDAVGVACPGGTRLHGLGGTITGATGRALFGGLFPDAALTTAAGVTIEQSGGFAGNWHTTVHAICAT